MTPQNNEKPPEEREADEQQPLAHDFRRVIEEYANELRHILEKLRKRLH